MTESPLIVVSCWLKSIFVLSSTLSPSLCDLWWTVQCMCFAWVCLCVCWNEICWLCVHGWFTVKGKFSLEHLLSSTDKPQCDDDTHVCVCMCVSVCGCCQPKRGASFIAFLPFFSLKGHSMLCLQSVWSSGCSCFLFCYTLNLCKS